MSGKILQINYKLNGPRAEYEKDNLPYAQPIADIPGLRWKVWIINEAQSEAGGIYLFDDDAAAQSFVDGPVVSEMKGDPTLSIKAFDVIAELTTITRGPVKYIDSLNAIQSVVA
ncbi:YdhR family protein [Mesorhizobium sophorae]|uniref:YdhR family protein n=1 Tax=Mesorhizobium sophorae TaxID=1300294 RepID=UPI000BA38129|nr:YdhR family protein [Mesorhizobium sophorae]